MHTRTLPDGDGWLLVQGVAHAGGQPRPAPAAGPWFDYEILVAVFDTTRGPVQFAVDYEGWSPDLAPDWGATLPAAPEGHTFVYFPAYYAVWDDPEPAWTHFRGLRVPAETRGRLTGLYRVTDATACPLLLTVVSRPAARPAPWQRMVR